VGIAEFVKIEQFRRQRLAAGVPLALVLVDVDLQLSRHCNRFPSVMRVLARAHCVFHFHLNGRGHLGGVVKL
jgi:hypothetical protein